MSYPEIRCLAVPPTHQPELADLVRVLARLAPCTRRRYTVTPRVGRPRTSAHPRAAYWRAYARIRGRKVAGEGSGEKVARNEPKRQETV